MKTIKKETNPSSKLPIGIPITDEQLLVEITHMVDRIPGRFNLDEYERQDAITDSFMIIRRKMTDGTIKDNDFESRKNYVFITCRSTVFQYLNKKTKELKRTDYLEEITYNEPSIPEKTFLNDYKRLLNESEVLVLEMLEDGCTKKEIGFKLNLNYNDIYKIINNIKIKMGLIKKEKKIDKIERQKTYDEIYKPEKVFKFKNGKYQHREIRLILIDSEEEIIFENQPTCGAYLGKRKGSVNAWLKSGNLFKINNIRYKLKYLD